MNFLRRDNICKDLAIWFLVSIILAASFAAGLSVLTDHYFGRTIAGIIGDSGEYDLLFQVRSDMKGKTVEQLEQIVAEHFPGANIHAGVSIANRSTIFLTFPKRYYNKTTFTNLKYYFGNLPSGAGYSIMTEPRISVTGVPGGVYDQLIREFESVKDVRFAFQDGSTIQVVLKNANVSRTVTKKIKKILRNYQVLEVRFPSSFQSDDTLALGKRLTQALAGNDGIRYIRDVTMGDQSDDYQALLTTMSQIKKFLLAYTGQVILQPLSGVHLEIGDQVALAGDYKGPIRPGMVLRPEQVVAKIIEVEPEIKAMIIQGDASDIKENNAYLLNEGGKLGKITATVTVDSQKDRMIYALDQGVTLLSQAKNSASNLADTSSRARETVAAASDIRSSMLRAQQALERTRKSLKSLSSGETQRQLESLASVLASVGGDLESLSKSFARVRIVEGRLQQAVQGVRGVQYLMNLGLLKLPGYEGDINDRMEGLSNNLDGFLGALNERAQILDDFINRFNPLVQILLSWQDKADTVAQSVKHISGLLGKDVSTSQLLEQLTGVTNETLQAIDSLDFASINKDLQQTTQQLTALNQVDLNAIIQQMTQAKNALPDLMDDELGRSVELINRYLDGEVVSGEFVKIFTNSGVDLKAIQNRTRQVLNNSEISVSVLPAGSIDMNLRGEVLSILREVKGVIAALVVLILFILFFLLDQSAIMSVFKRDELMGEIVSIVPKGSWQQRFMRRFSGMIYAVLIGAFWMTLTFLLSGASIPYLPWPVVSLVGGLLGLLAYVLADRIYQLDVDEIMAGQSLGLSLTAIMREIVIPSGRPGLLQILNARKMVMRG